jgi:hypothetical protein
VSVGTQANISTSSGTQAVRRQREGSRNLTVPISDNRTMSIDHIAYYTPTPVFKDEIAFLTASLKHLDIVELVRIPGMENLVGLGKGQKAFLWVSGLDESKGTNLGDAMHIALTADCECVNI